ncbi:hypothetical protein [Aquabacterium humicola]|uniref:hypothetical protein n=1 Tax=Aquabacterium humicola TaxID=3237377 RepID=UPI0025428D31|nr:hypothetical protein [Rubrivivax pictus]
MPLVRPACPSLLPRAPAHGALLACVVLGTVAGPAAAQPVDLQAELALASALTDRGLAVFAPRPTLQLALGASRGRWAVSLAASQRIGGSDQPRVAARLSHYRPLDDDWQLDAGLSWYTYPGEAYARAYDRVEAGGGLAWRDVLSIGLTAIDYRAWPGRRGGLQWALDLGLRWPIAGGWSATASAGEADLPPYPQRRYRYGGLGLAWQSAGWRVELGRLGADGTARRWLGAGAAARWSALVAKNF